MLLGAVVLSGGASRRMGQPKASISWRGSALLTHLVDQLMLCSWPVLVVGREPEQELPPLPIECERADDTDPGTGPLAALATGMRELQGRADAVVACGCDLPFFSPEAVSFLAEQLAEGDLGVVPQFEGQPQPLAAIYRLSLLPRIEELLTQDERRAKALAAVPGVRTLPEDLLRGFDPELRFLRNLNTPEQLEQAREDERRADR